MAFFVPALASVGTALGASAGSAAIVGGLAIATVGTGLMSAKMQYDAGKISEAEYKLQAKQEGDAARAREIERKRGLLRALSTQNARAGAQGVAIQGSNAAIANRDIKDFSNDMMYDRVNTKTAQRILRSRGSNSARMGRVGAITSLVDTASSVYQMAG